MGICRGGDVAGRSNHGDAEVRRGGARRGEGFGIWGCGKGEGAAHGRPRWHFKKEAEDLGVRDRVQSRQGSWRAVATRPKGAGKTSLARGPGGSASKQGERRAGSEQG